MFSRGGCVMLRFMVCRCRVVRMVMRRYRRIMDMRRGRGCGHRRCLRAARGGFLLERSRRGLASLIVVVAVIRRLSLVMVLGAHGLNGSMRNWSGAWRGRSASAYKRCAELSAISRTVGTLLLNVRRPSCRRVVLVAPDSEGCPSSRYIGSRLELAKFFGGVLTWCLTGPSSLLSLL